VDRVIQSEPQKAERVIQSYIEEERTRCAALVAALIGEPDFLLYCINAPVYPDEIGDQRKRFAELPDKDNFEDLM
jgi:hypothetical protein